MSGQWVKLYRKLLDSQVWSDPNTRELFIYLLLTVNWKDGWFHGKKIPRGSTATSIELLAERLEWSPSKTIRTIDKCIDQGVVTKQATNKYTVLTIVKYCTYQDNEEPNRRAIDRTTDQSSDKTTGEQVTKQPETIEERKKERREERKTEINVRENPVPVPPSGATRLSKSRFKFSDRDFEVAESMVAKIRERLPKMKKPNLDSWANTVRLMVERDDRTHCEVAEMFTFAQDHDFWHKNILSPETLRRQWDRLTLAKIPDNGRANLFAESALD